MAGGKALLRWFHPERGQIPTADFIALAEETSLVADLGRWTLGQVCRDMNAWRAQGLDVLSMAATVSGGEPAGAFVSVALTVYAPGPLVSAAGALS